MLCQDCPKRSMCEELCPDAERYVGQDEVVQREKPIGLPRTKGFPDLVSNTPLTKKERQIVTLLRSGLDRGEVCQLIGITRHALREAIRRLKKKRDASAPL